MKRDPAELAAEKDGRIIEGNSEFVRFWNSPEIVAARERMHKENGLRKWFERAMKGDGHA